MQSTQTKRILSNHLSRANKSFLLTGPRQTGKTTLIQQLNPELEINLADQETFVRFLSDPGLLKKIISKSTKKIFIDEVQRLPSLLNTIQVLADKNKNIQFYLTGSSARKLRRGQANLLPGRILTYELGPLTHEELGPHFDLDKALKRGLLPGIYWLDSQELSEKILRSYSQIYLKEEIQAEALTRNLEGFSRFFQIIASRSGDFIDFSKFSSQAMIERTSARRFFDILIDTLVVYTLDPFTKSTKRRLIQHPRYYFFDVGVLNGCLENFSVSADRLGSLFEHLILQLILSSAKAHDHSIRVSVYRTEAGAEVDFIIERGREIFAVEVKASKNIGRSDIRGLASFKEFYGKKHSPIIIYLGDDNLTLEGVKICNLKSGLSLLGY